MHNTTTITLFPSPNEQPLHLTLRQGEETPKDKPVEQLDFQPIIDRLRLIYLDHIHRTDELSLLIQDVADPFIRMDCSKVSQLSEIIKIAQDCKNQFAQVLYSDFDLAFLKTPADFKGALLKQPVELRGWKFEEWQIKDFIKLDKYFGQTLEARNEAVSPFDKKQIPEQLPKHVIGHCVHQKSS